MDINQLISDIEERANYDGKVDYIKLRTGFDMVNEIGSFILGLACTLLLIIIPLIMILEIIYINVPIVRSGIDKVSVAGSGTAKKIVQFSMRDAIKAITEANTIQTGKSANLVYLRIKYKWIFIVFFVLGMVLLGTGTIVEFIMSMLSGLLELLTQAIS